MKTSACFAVLLIGFIFSCKNRNSSSSEKAISSDDAQALTGTLTDMVKRKQNVIGYLNKYGVVRVKEENMTQSGSISGSPNGSMSGGGGAVKFGNAGALVKTVLGLTTNLEPFPTAGALLNSMDGGWGGGSMQMQGAVNGQISGTFKGSGQVIHNTASLYYVSVLSNKLFSKEARQEWDRPEYRNGVVAELRKIAGSKYLASEDEHNSFLSDLQGIQTSMNALELLSAKYAADMEATGVFANVRNTISDIKETLSSKRLVTTFVGENLAPLSTYERTSSQEFKVQVLRSDYYNGKKGAKNANPELVYAFFSFNRCPRDYYSLYDIYPPDRNTFTVQYHSPNDQIDESEVRLLVRTTMEQAGQDYYTAHNPQSCGTWRLDQGGFLEQSYKYSWYSGNYAENKKLTLDDLIAKKIVIITPSKPMKIDMVSREGQSTLGPELTRVVPPDQSGIYLLSN